MLKPKAYHHQILIIFVEINLSPRHESALPSETPGKGEISNVIALHVKTESVPQFLDAKNQLGHRRKFLFFVVTNQLCVGSPW